MPRPFRVKGLSSPKDLSFSLKRAEIKTKSANVLLKMTTILKELRIAQLRSKNKRTLVYEPEVQGLDFKVQALVQGLVQRTLQCA